ncbi:MAG TPA: IS5 family transposase [Aggregatilineales bacterium]|nr:IS5 family transposase [Anaerolineales bacterium]HRE48460.1 IS5 family transposase [Aggregatilineales bacterium]
MSRHDLSDEQWAVVEPLIPKKMGKRGRPRNDDRQTLNGILYVLKTGCAWRDLPKEYGSDSTCWRRLNEWSLDGTWERIWRTFLGRLDGVGKTKVGKGAKVMTVVDGNGLPIGLHVDSAQPHKLKDDMNTYHLRSASEDIFLP